MKTLYHEWQKQVELAVSMTLPLIFFIF